MRATVQRHGVLPQQPQTIAQFGIVQIGQADAVAARIRERRVGGAAARELGRQLDHMADVDHDDERRPAFGCGQRAGIAFTLRAGAQQRVVEALCVGTGLDLLGFEHDGGTLVAVDEAVTGAAIAVSERDAALEDVGVVAAEGLIARFPIVVAV